MLRLRHVLATAACSALVLPAPAAAGEVQYRIESLTGTQRHVIEQAPTLDWRSDVRMPKPLTVSGDAKGVWHDAVPVSLAWNWTDSSRTFLMSDRPLGTGGCSRDATMTVDIPWRAGSIAVAPVDPTVIRPYQGVRGTVPLTHGGHGIGGADGDAWDPACYGPPEAVNHCVWFGGCEGFGKATATIKGDRLTARITADDPAPFNAWRPTGTTVHTSDVTIVIRRLEAPAAKVEAKRAKKAARRKAARRKANARQQRRKAAARRGAA